MTRAKRPILSLIISLVSLVLTTLVVWVVPPSNWFLEILVLLLLTVTVTLLSSWLIGNTKRGIQFTLAIVGLLVMQRFRILDLPTLGLWLTVVGLLSLVN